MAKKGENERGASSPDSAASRLCLRLDRSPGEATWRKAERIILSLARKIDIACMLAPMEPLAAHAKEMKPLIDACQAENVAALGEIDIQGDEGDAMSADGGLSSMTEGFELANDFSLDGVQLAYYPGLENDFSRMKSIIGEDMIFGVKCVLSRHDAMLAGEAGADYISFSPSRRGREQGEGWSEKQSEGQGGERSGERSGLEEMIIWWQELFRTPCMAQGACDSDELERLLAIPAEFICLEQSFWFNLEDGSPLTAMLAEKCPSRNPSLNNRRET
jgi:hypothetical protein